MGGKFHDCSAPNNAKVAQLVEHTPEKRGVASSILALGIFHLLFLPTISHATNFLHQKILWDEHPDSTVTSNDQQAFVRSLSSIGIRLEKIPTIQTNSLRNTNVLIVPHGTAAKLSNEEQDAVIEWASGGGNLVVDGESPLSDKLGVVFSMPVSLSRLKNHIRSNNGTRWPDGPRVKTIVKTGLANVQTFYSSTDGEHSVVVGGTVKNGKAVVFSTLFDDATPYGFGRFTDLPHIMVDFFKITPLLRAQRAIMYMDPGFHFNPSESDLKLLVDRWADAGVSSVHVGTWHSDSPNPFPYATLINLAHQKKISVLAWFEWPHVSEQFWNDHPECREKTATLADAHVDWRLLINFQNPRCRALAFEKEDKVLRSAEWDGVDIAEIYFDPVDGLKSLPAFTPLNDDVRKGFSEKQGFDPVLLFDESSSHFWEKDSKGIADFLEYRRRLTTELTEIVFSHIRKLEKNQLRKWDIVLTLTDVLGQPMLRDNIAIDFDANLALAKRYGATVEIQDAYIEWSKTPDRYLVLGERYAKIFGQNKFMIDINVVDSAHGQTQLGFSTPIQSGTELFQLWATASKFTRQVVAYSESTIHPKDYDLLPYAMASDSSVDERDDGLRVHALDAVELRKPTNTSYRVDGKKWNRQNDSFIWLPAGEHLLTENGPRATK